MDLGPPLPAVLASAALSVIVIWGIVDAAIRPDWAWQRAGQNKVLWILLMLFGLLCCGIVGLVSAVIYLASIRQQVRRHEDQPWYPPGAPPQGSPPPGTWPPSPGSPPPESPPPPPGNPPSW